MVASDFFKDVDPKATAYHFAHPKHADFDLRIFKSLCEGKTVDAISAEHACNRVAISASLNRVSKYMVSHNLFSIVEIFRYVLYNATIALSPPHTMGSVIDMLYHAASEGGMVKNEDTQEQFSRLYELSSQMPPQVADEVSNTVCEIWGAVERISFAEGVKIGFHLGKELTA